jgi:hypothetical protein
MKVRRLAAQIRDGLAYAATGRAPAAYDRFVLGLEHGAANERTAQAVRAELLAGGAR